MVGNFYIFYSLQLYKSIYITGTKNALKHTGKHKRFGNYDFFMRESKGTLSILKLAWKFCKTIDLTKSNKYVIEVSKTCAKCSLQSKVSHFFLDCQHYRLVTLKPLDQSWLMLPLWKDPIRICLCLEVLGYGWTFT